METNLSEKSKQRKKISLLTRCSTNEVEEDIFLDDFLDDIKEGAWSSLVAEAGKKSRILAPGQKKTEYTLFKENKVPAVTIHGTFHHRSDKGIKERNFIAAMDFDHVSNLSEVISILRRDPYSYCVFRSLGGDGICLLVQVDPEQSHDLAHDGLRRYYENKYKLTADRGAKDLARLRAVSYDPNLWINVEARVWKTLEDFKVKKSPPLLPENNHRAQILPLVASRLAKGDTLDEVEAIVNEAHIAATSCMSDPDEVKKLITDLQERYFKGREGRGLESIQYSGFWTNNFKSDEIQLSTGLLLEILEDLGYAILDGEYVQVREGVIYKVTKTELYAFVIEITSLAEVTFQVKDKKVTYGQTALKTRAQSALKGNLSLLGLKGFNRPILRDSATEIYLHFKNQSLRITCATAEHFTRTGDACIFEKQLIPHDILPAEEATSVFEEFVKNISGNNFGAFKSTLGYLLRNYNSSDGMRAIWLCDKSFLAGKSMGRTGKSLLRKAVTQLRKTDECSGKEWDEKSQFKFQNMSRDTQLYAIEDVQPGFNFNVLFTACTEGLEYQAKHRDRIKLSIQETPKIVITSNRPPKLEDGSSMLGRLVVLPVTNFYVEYAPLGGVKYKHGHTFFDDWDPEEMSRFFHFMVGCAIDFLKEGLKAVDMVDVRKNRYRELCFSRLKDGGLADDFTDWVYDQPLIGNIDPTHWRTAFTEHIGEDSIDQTVFGLLLKNFLDMEGVKFEKKRTHLDGAKKTLYLIDPGQGWT